MAKYPYDLLLPSPDPETQPWWDAVRRHQLVIQSCGECGTLRHPPCSVCANCGSEARGWRQMSGQGVIYSHITVHRSTLPMWKDEVPYNVVMVALEEAPNIRLYGNVVGLAESSIRIGMKVTATFEDVTDEDTIIRWQPVLPA